MQAPSTDNFVETSYKDLAKLGALTTRPAQVQLSSLISESFLSKIALIAEAPTGTGKTVAYLVGALSARKASGLPIVVSTATKVLQQQLISNDLPRLFAAGLLAATDVAIAKGKSNYICIQAAHETIGTLAQSETDPEAFLSDRVANGSSVEIENALKALDLQVWDGDFDQYGQAMSAHSKRAIAVSSDTCTGKKCDHYGDCAYYKAKASAQGRSVIVTNHDLLLMDLLLVSQGTEPTLSVADYYLVIDEAHRLPQKAIQVGSFEAPLTQLLQALPKLQGVQRIIKGSPELKSLLLRHHLDEASFDKTASTFALRDLIFALMDMPVDEYSSMLRFSGGVLPEPLKLLMETLIPLLTDLSVKLSAVASVLKDTEGVAPPVHEKARELQHRAIDVKRLVCATEECLLELLTGVDYAKWLFRKEDSLILHCAPLEGAQVLRKLLWNTSRVKGVVLVSATLQDLDGFTRFKKKIGAPASSITKVLPHTFAYEESALVVAGMEHSPKPAERRLFIPELKAKLPVRIDDREGTLAVFPSWALLQEMVPVLKSRLGPTTVKVQGELPIKLLVEAHKRDIDEGRGSVLVGVATLSEGLDLPGNYCTHVIVIALPFAVPNDPVEQELAELLGSRYFGERSLPDAMARLTQIVGRLLRRETDRGRVTVFDRRLATTGYGRQMLKSLPPFKTIVEPVTSL